MGAIWLRLGWKEPELHAEELWPRKKEHPILRADYKALPVAA